jgi:hypothetical protein
MNLQQAVEIRDRAKRLGLAECCDECAADIAILERLGERGNMTIIPPSHPESVQHTQRKEPVLGTTMEDAARRLRRSIGAAA